MAQPKSGAESLAAGIDGRILRSNGGAGFRLVLSALRPVKSRIGWFYLTINLAASDGAVSTTPLLRGIVSGGGRGVKPWFECRLYWAVEFENRDALDTRGSGLDEAMVNLLGRLVPRGGHVMIDYEAEGQEQTFQELQLKVPPAATRLGAMMFAAGFKGAFKDWYFSEGGHEGPRKLQGNKPPDVKSLREALEAHRRELSTFVRRRLPSGTPQALVVSRARKRARSLIAQIDSGDRRRRAQARR